MRKIVSWTFARFICIYKAQSEKLHMYKSMPLFSIMHIIGWLANNSSRDNYIFLYVSKTNINYNSVWGSGRFLGIRDDIQFTVQSKKEYLYNCIVLLKYKADCSITVFQSEFEKKSMIILIGWV